MRADQSVESSRAQVAAAETTTSASAEEASVQIPSPSVPRWAVIGTFLLLLVASIAYARAFLIPVVLGFLLALVFSPVRRFLERRGLPSGLSARSGQPSTYRIQRPRPGVSEA
jgi:hypothetical protein